MGKDTWLKLHTSILTSQKFVNLPSNDHRSAFFCLLLLTKKGLESAPECYLLAHLHLGKKRWKTVKKELIESGLLDASGSVNGFEESQLSPEAIRKRDQRWRKNVTDKQRDKSRDSHRDSRKQKADKKEPPNPPLGGLKNQTKEVLEYWNSRHGRKISAGDKIEARIKQGATVEDCRIVIDFKTKQWTGTKFQKNLQPATLFAPSHFSDYLSEAKEGDMRNDGIYDY